MVAPEAGFRASWYDVVERLALLTPPSGHVLEVDRAHSALPPDWQTSSAERRILVIPPVDQARQFAERDLTPAKREGDPVAQIGFIAERNYDEHVVPNPLSYTSPEEAPVLHARTLEATLDGLSDVGMLILGGQVVDPSLIGAASAQIRRLRPIIVLRSPPSPATLAATIAEIGRAASYNWLGREELRLGAARSETGEHIAIGVPDLYVGGPLAMALAPRQLVPQGLGDASGLRPFARPIGGAAWPRAWTLPASDLRASRHLGADEKDGDLSWRWSNGSGEAVLYLEVPAPDDYRITLNIPFCVSPDHEPTTVICNGRRVAFTFTGEGRSLAFEAPLFRHALIHVFCPVRQANDRDHRKLGFALTSIRFERLGR